MIENGEYMSKYVENKDGYIVFGSLWCKCI